MSFATINDFSVSISAPLGVRVVDKRSENVSEVAKIVIVDDSPIVITTIRSMLMECGYRNIFGVNDPALALPTILGERPDLVLLDSTVPALGGLALLEKLRADERFTHMPIVVLTADNDKSVKTKAIELGANDFLDKPVNSGDLLPRVRNMLLLKNHQNHLERIVRERTLEMERSREEVILCLARAAEFRDNETGNHVWRVGLYSGVIGRALGFDQAYVRMLQQAATLHDVGKIGIPDSILLKPGKLTDDEFEFMQRHCVFGKRICGRMNHEETFMYTGHPTLGAKIIGECTSPILKLASSIALTHHEKWDGTGYPLGLAGESIPIEGRITAVADVFDALSTKRPYKPAFPVERCFEILRDESGRHFDPHVVEAFFERQTEILDIQKRFADIE